MTKGRADGKDGRPDGVPDAAALERYAREAMEQAGIQGLCREGRIEAAVGVLRSLHPELSAAAAFAIVRRVVDDLS